MKIKFFLRNAIVDWMVPPEQAATFNFPGFCKVIRSDGYFISQDFYIPHSEIVSIGMDSGQNFFNFLQGNAPSTGVKQ